jgi:chromosomal replication initiator protein
VDIQKIWATAQKAVADKVSSISFDCWIKPLVAEAFEQCVFILAAESRAGKEQAVNERHFKHIEAALKDAAPIIEKVQIIDAVEKEERDKKGKEQPTEKKTVATERPQINPVMTFDNFIVGKSNEVVAAASEGVAKNPGRRINPLFIYGGVGLGKTHLLNAIANHVMNEKPNLNIVFATSEKFTNDYVYTMKNKDNPTEAFRAKYRTADVLLIDDIQFIRDKPSTQEEFFHTFNDLHQNGRQIVLTSDRHPDEMPNLQERMRSRFKSGLIQDIGSPDVEMRMAILQKKALIENYHIDDEVIEYIAQTALDAEMNIRDMEGLFFKVIFYGGFFGRSKPTIEDCRAVMKESPEEKKIQTTADHIIDKVCKYFQIRKSDLTGKKRNREFAEPRTFAIYLICEYLNIPLASIGQLLGNRDHTTIMHGRNKIQGLLVTDARTKMIVKDLTKMIKGE